MKRTKNISSLLTGAAAAAGVVMGASLAMAAVHPSIQLFTYEEVASQMNGPVGANSPTAGMPLPVLVNPTNKQGFAYSPKQTCTGGGTSSTRCHADNTNDVKSSTKAKLTGYTALADHAFHAALGYNEWMDNSPSGLFVSTGPADLVPAGTQTGLVANKPWVQSHGHNGKW